MVKNKTGRKWKKRAFFIILALVVIGVALFLYFRPKAITTDTISVKTGSISTFYSFSGSIEARNREMIFADQALQIKEWKVKEGDIVKVDDILYVTKLGIEKKAAIKGEVLTIYADVNQQIMPGAKILEIVDYTDYLLKVKVDEYDFASIKVNGVASVKLNSLDTELDGIVEDISKEGIYMNGVTYFQATISIPANDKIRVGMSAEAKVLNQKATDVPILPIEAILFDAANNPYVNQIKDNISSRVDVVLGITDGVYVEVKSGVVLGDQVAVKKANTLENFRPGSNR